MFERWLRALLACVLLFGGGTAAAGSFGVSPLRVDFAGSRQVAVLQVTNTGDAPLALQAQAQAWPGAADGGAPPIVVNPAVATLLPRQTQTFRVGLLDRPGGERERSYRLYFAELPSGTPESGGLGVLLRVGVPVFVAPAQVDARPLQWRLAGDALEVHNPGNVHQRLNDVELLDDAGRRVAEPALSSPYLLAGQTVTLPLPPPAAGMPRSVRARSAGAPLEQRLRSD